MLLATALACLLQDVLNRRLLFKTNRQRVALKTITHHFFVSGIGQENCRYSGNCGGAENVVKTSQQTFVNELLGFITLGIYTPLEARVYCSQ